MTMGVLSVVAQFERDLLIERTQAGLERAKAEGKTLGRPVLFTAVQQDQVRTNWLVVQASQRSPRRSIPAGRPSCGYATIRMARQPLTSRGLIRIRGIILLKFNFTNFSMYFSNLSLLLWFL